MVVVDADEAHVAAIRECGLVLRRPGGDERVAIQATTPQDAPAMLAAAVLHALATEESV